MELKDFKNDTEKWEWVIKNKHNGIVIMLDNDCTFCVLDDTVDDSDYFPFDHYIGNTTGIETLLKVMGITARGV